MVSSVTLEDTHLPFSSASAIAGEKCERRESLEAQELIGGAGALEAVSDGAGDGSVGKNKLPSFAFIGR